MSLILLGTFLLTLPLSSTDEPLSVIDALFTSTSASCVTGLSVIDIGKHLSRFGQLTVLVLIQAGGLGIMTISTIFLLMAGKQLSLTEQIVIRDTFTQSGERSLNTILKDIVLFTVFIEAGGALLLFIRFLPARSTGEAAYLAVFHSISAFCNAGFSIFPTSLVNYAGDGVVNVVVIFLIVSGGIGFLVLSELKRSFPVNRRTWSRLSLHTKLMLSSTALLLFFSAMIIAAMEWHNTLASLSVPERIMAAFFQAATTRTAGFNTIAIGGMANETLFFFILLMFIGAGPGSCAGGIKITTLATVTLLALSRLLGYSRPQIFHRTISEESAEKAVGIAMLSGFIVVLGTMLLLITELGDVSHLDSRGNFLEILFETISAFGTVGLSTGITETLSSLGKLIITSIMFMGRLGPMVIVVAISRNIAKNHYHATENIMIG